MPKERRGEKGQDGAKGCENKKKSPCPGKTPSTGLGRLGTVLTKGGVRHTRAAKREGKGQNRGERNKGHKRGGGTEPHERVTFIDHGSTQKGPGNRQIKKTEGGEENQQRGGTKRVVHGPLTSKTGEAVRQT